ncbi:DUF6227 family protein [Streptomyces sp. NBC_01498]|uniref:DUF6227 family protein n=1 Tax=Streptomyces sp. NBC_01498 TaxID=2975870 RepID=UPI002E7C178A|nr:DUF6227 family protein [Streptomyces sp. NBC_01498]WTL26342.1 DUF6227 family protein [Streptomyces sp. NBC_01498]
MNDPYETSETHIERLLGRALNSFDLPDTVIERLDSALAHASSLRSSHHSAGLHRETYRHTYLLADSTALTLWELVHNTGRDGAEQHEIFTDEHAVRLAASRLRRPGRANGAGAPALSAPEPAGSDSDSRPSSGSGPDSSAADPTDPRTSDPLSDPVSDSDALFESRFEPDLAVSLDPSFESDLAADLELLSGLLAAPLTPLPRVYLPDNSADHARRVLRRAENVDRPGEEVAEPLRAAFAHQITQVFGGHSHIEDGDTGFTLYEHAFLLLDGTETSLWEVEHTATPDGRHMCEVYAAQSAARQAMELRARVR